MTALVEELETGRLIPYISPSNKTRFANTLREHVYLSMYTISNPKIQAQKEKLLSEFDSWIQDPFERIVELGIQKCVQDISHHFASNLYFKLILNRNIWGSSF